MLPVLLSAVLHAGWNAMVKGGTDRYLDTLLVVTGAAVLAACWLPFVPLPAPESRLYLVGSSLIHVCYFAIVALAYQRGDMSLVYPLTRGSAPALTALTALVFLHERPSPGGWAGVLLVSGGILLLASDSRRKGRFQGAPVCLALTNAGVVVLYTLVDGTGARLSGHAFAYTGWMTLLTAAMFFPIALAIRGKSAVQHLVRDWRKGLAGGACTLASYCLALWAMTQAPLALVSAVRETSVVFGAAIAVIVLGERITRLRCASIAIVALGAIMIKLLGKV
jgi:drug/metabolite transporter (DMT)-like permease